MSKQLICDVCQKETEEIAGKMFLSPVGRGNPRNGFHVNYSHHGDVGVCCWSRVLKSFHLRERQTAKEYAKSRSRSTAKKK